MGVTKVTIRLETDDSEIKDSNRWKDGRTYLFLFPFPAEKLRAGERGRWDSDRQIDIDSVAGNEHAVYSWDIVNKRVDILSAGWQSPDMTEVLVKLNGFNRIEYGGGTGTFKFRKADRAITWKIEATNETG